MKDEQSAASATAATSHQSSSKMMTLFLSLIWAEAILYLAGEVCSLLNDGISLKNCADHLSMPILGMFLAFHLTNRKSWARKTYLILTVLGIVLMLTLPESIIGECFQANIISKVSAVVGICCFLLCFNSNIVAAYAVDRDSKEQTKTNRFQCVVYWVLFFVIVLAGAALDFKQEIERVKEEHSAPTNDYPPVSIEWWMDDDESYIKLGG